jgi:hypothetical protein
MQLPKILGPVLLTYLLLATSFYQTPESGSANAVVIKGNLYAQLTMYKSGGNLTAPAVKNLLIYVAEQL